MYLQLHDNGLEASWLKKGFRFVKRTAKNPYQELYKNRKQLIRGAMRLPSEHPYREIFRGLHDDSPTMRTFLYDEGLSGLEDEEYLSSRFGKWLKKTSNKAVTGINKLQKFAAPVIGFLPGGAAVNSVFDVINRPKDAAGMEPTVQPVAVPVQPQIMPPAPAPMMPQ